MPEDTTDTTEVTENDSLLTLTKSDVGDKVVGAIITTVTCLIIKEGYKRGTKFLETRKARKSTELESD